jgi:hypothetical protein
MTTTPNPASCPLCDKPGLPILPVRYAVARKDLGHAPSVSAPFAVGSKEKDQGKSLALPDGIAHYTLRLLRPGYLYMYHEARREWTAYVVTRESYLYAFDFHSKSPPDVPNKTFSEACNRKGDPYAARCVSVRDPSVATKIWLGFSDVAWTDRIKQNHASPAYRQVHMQCIDIAAWRGGGRVPHTAPVSALTSHVAEFAVDSQALQQETTAYVTPYLKPFTPAQLIQNTPQANTALGSLSPLIQDLLPQAVGGAAPSTGYVPSAAWAFSPQHFYVCASETKPFIDWSHQAAHPYQVPMLALDDAAGIAMELNGLALQRALEFTDMPDTKWRLQTALSIESVKEAVLNGAVEEQSQKQQDAAAVFMPLVPNALIRDSNSVTAMSQNIVMAGQVSQAEKKRLAETSWPKYQNMYNEEQREQFLNQYKSNLHAFDQDTIMPLDAIYVAWLKSNSFRAHLTHNFDSDHPNSGLAYQQLVYACIKDATGRNAPFEYFKQCLGNDVSDPRQIVLRALIFNQDTLATRWAEAAVAKGTEHEVSYLEIGAKIYEALKDTFIKSSMGANLDGPLLGICKMLYQLGGPLTSWLGDALNKAVHIGLLALPERKMLGLMKAVLHAEHPNLELMDLRSMRSPRQAAKALAQAVAMVSGGSAQNLYGSAEDMVKETMHSETSASRGLFLLDTQKLKNMASANNTTRLSAVQAEEFDALFLESTRSLVNPEVKAGIIGALLGALTLRESYGALAKADAEAATEARWNFGSGVVSLVGTSFELAGNVLEKTPWAEVNIARQMGPLKVSMAFRAKWLTTGGKVLGVVGGVIAGALEIYDGIQEWKLNAGLGFTMILLGAAEVIIAVIAAAATSTLFIGIGLALGLLIAAAIWITSRFKSDDLQKWLDGTIFGKHKASQFPNLLTQQNALAKIAGAH